MQGGQRGHVLTGPVKNCRKRRCRVIYLTSSWYVFEFPTDGNDHFLNISRDKTLPNETKRYRVPTFYTRFLTMLYWCEYFEAYLNRCTFWMSNLVSAIQLVHCGMVLRKLATAIRCTHSSLITLLIMKITKQWFNIFKSYGTVSLLRGRRQRQYE